MSNCTAIAAARLQLTALLLILLGCAPTPRVDVGWIEYPPAERVDQIDEYHGVEIADPYRWLEDEGSDRVQRWLAAQDDITERFFGQLEVRQKMVSYLDEHWYTGAIGIPIRRGDNTFFWEWPSGLDHLVLWVRRGDAEPEVVFDLNSDDPSGRRSTLPANTVSPQGRYVSYEIHYDGADFAEIHLYDVEEARKLDDIIPTSFAAITSWLPDESGFYYTWVDEETMLGQPTAKPAGIYLHRIGDRVEGDQLVYKRPWQGMFMATAVVTEDEEHLLVSDMNIMGSRGGWAVRPLQSGSDVAVHWMIDPTPEHRFAYVGNQGSELFLITDHRAPNWRIVAADFRKSGVDNLREVVPEGDEPIAMSAGSNAGVVLHGDHLYVTYIRHNASVIRVFDLEGKPDGEIALPFPATVTGLRALDDDPVLYLGLTSFLVPHTLYAYDTVSGELSTLGTAPQASFADFEVTRVFYDSYDGTRIPMSLIHRRGQSFDGDAKVLLYGYGGWGIPLMPAFSNRIHAWLERGGIYAVANLRGGVEYGETWHQSGQLLNKQNVFDDFAAAAEYLVRERYTSHSRITIIGASNGGLLTAASYNQRPELFGAVISEVAAVDLLRLPETPVGATQTMELGAPSTGQEMFEYLLGYSPLHNVRHQGPYPPILHIVGENDPRCKPGHIYKYVAEMQQTPALERLAVLRVVRGAGHGSARKADNVAWAADELAFAWAMTD